MIVVSDTSPLNYLVLIGQEQVLPTLFGQVIAPPAVVTELTRLKTPVAVKAWASTPPAWLEVRAPSASRVRIAGLGPGESEAISLAQELHADALLIDERDGTKAARRLGLFVTGTLGVLEMAAKRGFLSLRNAIHALRQTTFRCPEAIIEELLQNDQRRHVRPKGRRRRGRKK